MGLKDFFLKDLAYLALTPEMLRTPRRNAISITCFGSKRVKIIIHWTGKC